MKYCKCPYIIPYVDCNYNGSNIDIITKYAKHGDLSSFFNKKKRKLEECTVWSYFIQTCLGVKYLHENNIIHRDIKSANIFLGSCDRIYIGDFGVSKVLIHNSTFAKTCIGTPIYMGPELFEKNLKYGKSVDIWGLGCLLFELITYRQPFYAHNMRALTNKISTQTLSQNLDMYKGRYTENLLNLVGKILCKQDDRPDIHQLLSIDCVVENMYLIPYSSEYTTNIDNFDKIFSPTQVVNKSWNFIVNNI